MNALQTLKSMCGIGKHSTRELILSYEERAKDQEQIEIPVTHYIHGGMYAREATIPANSILTGQIYKYDHFDIMISGDITVATDKGELERFTGYNLFKGMYGKKRAGVTHKDTVWITMHPFTGVDGDTIQSEITADSFEDLELFLAQVNRVDFKSIVSKLDISEEEVRRQSEITEDLIPFTPGDYDHLYVGDSFIEGKGFFSSHDVFEGEVICFSRILGGRTPAGRYTNHAMYPNTYMAMDGGDVYLVSNRDISAGEEITINYMEVLEARLEAGDDIPCEVLH